mgnify:CR=1 FL=1
MLGSRQRLDATLPDEIPVAELFADLVEMLGESANGSAVEWGLVRVGGRALDPELSLSDQGVADGTMLFLRDLAIAPPPPVVQDFAQRVAVAVDAQRGRWRGSSAPALLVWAGGACLAVAGLIDLGPGTPGWRAEVGAAGAAISVLAALTFVTALRRRGLAAVVAFSGLPAWAATGAALATLAGAGPTVVLAAWLGAAAIGALAAIAIAGDAAFAPAEAVVAGAGIPAVVIAICATFSAGLVAAAAVLCPVELLALALVAPAAVRLGGIDSAPPGSIVARLRRARNLQAASIIGTAVVITASCLVLAGSGGWFARALVAVTSIAIAARARHYRFAAEVAPLLAASIASVILLELALPNWFATLLLADAVVILAAAIWVRRWDLTPQLTKSLRAVEILAIALAVPLAAGVLGLYDAAIHVARGLV